MRTREKENRSKEMKQESTHLAIFFFIKQKEDLTGGTTVAKTSPPPGDRSDTAGTGALEELGAGAPEELIPDDRLLQKDQDQSQNKEEGFNSRKIRKQLIAA